MVLTSSTPLHIFLSQTMTRGETVIVLTSSTPLHIFLSQTMTRGVDCDRTY